MNDVRDVLGCLAICSRSHSRNFQLVVSAFGPTPPLLVGRVRTSFMDDPMRARPAWQIEEIPACSPSVFGVLRADDASFVPRLPIPVLASFVEFQFGIAFLSP